MVILRDVRIKYKQSIMGFMWAILMPMLIVMVGVLVRYVFSVAAAAPMEFSDVAAVAIKSVPWAFTVASIRFASSSLIGNSNLVTKIYFPKEIFPMAAVGSNFFDFCIASIPLTLLVIVAGPAIGFQLLWVPLLLIVLIMILIGIGLVVSAAGLFFRDVKYIVEILLTFGIFFTPVFFDSSMLGRYSDYMMLNPLSAVFEGLEGTIMKGAQPDLYWLGYSAVFGLVVLLGGYRFFKRLEPAFAESI
jgi:ABC-type polysaccharide/polyol phosphate export permease